MAGSNPTSPLTVNRLPPATNIAAGGANACAIVSGGVLCWGDQPRILPDDPLDGRPYFVVPARSDAVSIATNGSGGCAVARVGVLCWSTNYGAAAVYVIAPS